MKNLFLTIYKILFLIVLIYPLSSHSQAVGSVENLSGQSFILEGGSKLNLELYDEISINQEIILEKNTEITLSLNDGTTIILFNEANFYFNDYADIYSIKPYFELTLKSGSFTIETGEMPKLSPDTCKIHTPSGTLIINGTAISAEFSGTQSEIFLLTDSLGNKGNLDLITSDGNKVPFEIDKGLSIEGNAVQTKEISEQVQNKFDNLKTAIVQTTIVDEEKINNIYQEKLKSGKLKDANGDGKIDEADIEFLKKNVLSTKENKLNTIINNSGSNPEILSKIIENSKDDSSSKILEKVMESKPEITGNLVEKIIDNNPDKLDNLLKQNESLSEKVVETVVKEAGDNNNIGKILAKTSDEIATKILSNVMETKSELLTKVIADSSTNSNSKITALLSENNELQDQVKSSMAKSIAESPEGKEELKILLANVDTSLSNSVLEEVVKSDSKLVASAFTEMVKEDSATLEKKLAESLSKDSNLISELVIESAIKSGKTDLITKTTNQIIATPSKTNNTSQTTSSNNQNNSNQQNLQNKTTLAKLSEKIEQKTVQIKIENPQLKIDQNLIKNINEKLASPN